MSSGFFAGVPIRTHKPKAFKPNEASKGNINYRMKLAFLSQETIPDYRPLNVSCVNIIYSSFHAKIGFKHFEDFVQLEENWRCEKLTCSLSIAVECWKKIIWTFYNNPMTHF